MRRLLCSRWPWLRLTARFWARDSSCSRCWKQLQLKLRTLTTCLCGCPICLGNSDPERFNPPPGWPKLCGATENCWDFRRPVCVWGEKRLLSFTWVRSVVIISGVGFYFIDNFMECIKCCYQSFLKISRCLLGNSGFTKRVQIMTGAIIHTCKWICSNMCLFRCQWAIFFQK